jgi:hypothetical protein
MAWNGKRGIHHSSMNIAAKWRRSFRVEAVPKFFGEAGPPASAHPGSNAAAFMAFALGARANEISRVETYPRDNIA